MVEVGKTFKYCNRVFEITEIRQFDFRGLYKYKMVMAVHDDFPNDIFVLELPIELVYQFMMEE